MKRANERGQALVETLVAAPLFALVALGAFAYAQSLRAVLRRQAWEQFLSQSPATVPLALRERAGWPGKEISSTQELARERARGTLTPAEAGLCQGNKADAFCFDARFDAPTGAFTNSAPSALDAILSTQHHSVIQAHTPFSPDSLVPFANRAKQARAAGIASLARAAAREHPAHFVSLPSENWLQGGGFHMTRWLGTGPGNGDSTHALERALGGAARASRGIQLAACIAESAESAFIGGLWEAITSGVGMGSAPASGCAASREVFSALASTARLALRSEALSLHALEGCAAKALGPPFAGCLPKAAPGALLSALARLDSASAAAREAP